MKTQLFSAIRLTILCLVVMSGLYTGIVWCIAQAAPGQGLGNTIESQGRAYYANIGQSFIEDRYFQSRPSAVNYNAAGSGGSNLGPSNPAYLATVQARIDTLLIHNPGLDKADIPADLVTASGSGLDPHISVAGARVQVPRIARVRGLPEDKVQQLVDASTEGGWLGPQYVHVLKLNLALDQLK